MFVVVVVVVLVVVVIVVFALLMMIISGLCSPTYHGFYCLKTTNRYRDERADCSLSVLTDKQTQ